MNCRLGPILVPLLLFLGPVHVWSRPAPRAKPAARPTRPRAKKPTAQPKRTAHPKRTGKPLRPRARSASKTVKPGMANLKPATSFDMAMRTPPATRDSGQIARPSKGRPFRVRSQMGENRTATGPVSCTPTATKMLLDNRGIPNRDSVSSLYEKLHVGRDPRLGGTNTTQAVDNLNRSVLPPGHRASQVNRPPDFRKSGPYVATLNTSPTIGHSVLVVNENPSGNTVTLADPKSGRLVNDTDTDIRQKFINGIAIE